MTIDQYIESEAVVNETTYEDMKQRLILYGIMSYKMMKENDDGTSRSFDDIDA